MHEFPSIRDMITFRKGQTDLSDFTDNVEPAPGSDKDLYRKGVKELSDLCKQKYYLERYDPDIYPITGKDLTEKLANLEQRRKEISQARQDAYAWYKRNNILY